MMEAISSSEISFLTRATQRYIPADGIHHGVNIVSGSFNTTLQAIQEIK
jgi:hypothetical protein